MTLEKVESLENLINLKEKDVVVVVGSHGKTTFCLNLCDIFFSSNFTCIISL
mgnify:CR=1 FL=1